MNITIGSWKGSVEMLLILGLLLFILFAHLGCSCCRLNRQEYFSILSDLKEGFTGGLGKINTYQSTHAPPPDPAKWDQPTLSICPDQPLSQAVVDIFERKTGKIPLPNSQLDFFDQTEFKPECCPSFASDSMGCACMSMEQYNYLKQRGGNNVPQMDL